MPHNHVQLENFQLARLIELAERQLHVLLVIAREVAPPKLTAISVAFRKGHHMPATPGPVTLTQVGQTVVASVLGFDQFGQPFTGQIPTPVLSSDDTSSAIVTFDPVSGQTVAVADGVANITATLTTAEGSELTDTESVTVAITVSVPVLSSIKVAFE